jgi:deoxycytidylate deaminase
MKLPNGVIELAVSQALKSPMQHKHGAVIWKNKTILGAGYNYHLNAPTLNSRKVSIHSEKDCLTGIRGDSLYGSCVLAVRVTNSGELSDGAPCKGCRKLLRRKGVSKVYYFDKDKILSYIRLN